MKRASKTTDFVLPIDGIGTFTFGRRNFRDEISSSVEFARLTEGQSHLLEDDTKIYCTAIADLKVLTVDGPAAWLPDALDDLDAFDETAYANVLKVWSALRDKERSFRPGARQAGEAGGQGTGGDSGVVVPPEV